MKKFVLLTLMTLSLSTMATSPSLNKLIGQFDEKSDPDFVALDKTVLPVNKVSMYLQKETTNQLIKAYKDFKKSYPDIPFVVVSATRNYNYQNGIWSRKWNTLYPKFNNAQQTAEDILKYSSMPGSSRHHWGTDFDITSVSSGYFKNTKQGKILYQWLQLNMPKYGFCQPYNEDRNSGYQLEQWHWSYKPISKNYLEIYKNTLKQNPQTITEKLNFLGHKDINLEKLLDEYVLSINPDCFN